MSVDSSALKKTPLHPVHEQLGATFTGFAGWLMPVRYTSEIAEHEAVRKAAGLFDLSHMGEIEVVGHEAAAALDRALVGRPSAIGVGRARYSMICDVDGGVLDDLIVYRLAEEQFLVVANASNVDAVTQALRKRVAAFDAILTDASEDWALIAVQGPASVAILDEVVDVEADSLKYYSIDRANLSGAAVLLARTGYTGEDGFEIHCKPAEARAVWTAVNEAGHVYDLQPAGLACRDTLRLEAGMPLYGHELTRSLTPFDAGLGRVVALDKPGGFVGDASLARRRDQGVTKALVGLASLGRRSPRAGYAVHDPSSMLVIGEVTSGAPSPTLGRPIAMAYVDPAQASPGTRVLIDIRGSMEEAQVVPLPFYRRAD